MEVFLRRALALLSRASKKKTLIAPHKIEPRIKTQEPRRGRKLWAEKLTHTATFLTSRKTLFNPKTKKNAVVQRTALTLRISRTTRKAPRQAFHKAH